jgi:heat shock protein HslJ
VKAFKWFIPILVLVLLLVACESQTPVPEGPPPVESQATATPESKPTTPPEPEVQPTDELTTEPETEPTEEAPEISQPLTGWDAVSAQGNWVLVGYGDALNPIVVQPGTYVTINFSSSDDQVNGSGGCNSYFTSYTADDDGNLTIKGPVGATRMACETGMEQESMYLAALETVTGYTVSESGELLLDYDSGTVYEEQLVYIPETVLVDTVWVLTAYGDPNNLTLSKPGVVTTATFTANGTLNGSTGCNNYVAQYTLPGGNQITISLPATNLAACGIGMEQERAYMALLDAAQTYRLGINALEFSTADGTVLRYSAQHLPLENVRWSLAAIDGQAVPEGVTANALFIPAGSPDAQGDKNAVNGSAGCNNYFGPYTAAGDELTAGPFGVTRMMCEEPAMRVEQAFLAGLESAQTYQIMLDQLVITSESGSLLFKADRLPLEGPQWILTGRGPVDNPQPPIEGGIFTAHFARQFGMPSGTKSGATGCRDYIATHAASFDQIKVNLPQTSKGNCSDAQLEAEQGYFLGLSAARDYHISGNTMYVYYDDYVLIFVGNYPAADVGPLAPLNNTQWRLTSMDSSFALPSSEVTILFEINSDGCTGRVSGSGGCNTYNAEITGIFTLGAIINTTAVCDTPEGVMEQEGVYLTALQTANDLSVEGNTLKIATDQVTLNYTSVVPRPENPTPTPTPEETKAVVIAPSNENVGQKITYDGSLSTPSGGITSYRWWFTGDVFAEGVIVERTYEKTGAYDAILTITDANGQKSEASVKIKIHAYLVGPVWDSDDGPITLRFDGSTLSGNAGCNDYNAGYTASTVPGNNNEISVGSITTTQKLCDDEVMQQEKAYLTGLAAATRYIINFNRLTLTAADGSLWNFSISK